MAKKIKVAINGFGRIGRAFFKVAEKRSELEVAAVNDLGDIENFAYLLRHDTVYRNDNLEVKVSRPQRELIVNGRTVIFLSEKEPTKLPWGKLDIDVVVESTGLFTSFEKARVHITAGAKKVVISAPAKDAPKDDSEATVLLGINEEKLTKCKISSNASCTTNA
ncbi:MAG: glyceraldehyde 3-phosphate dehydrogenase NAD-binding domain-containing protein, partial [Patescibacteria group bacterium]